MPFTANRRFKASPRLFVGADGVRYSTADGRQVLDGISGMWCVLAGHGRKEISDAIAAQAAKMDYAASYQVAHPLAFELANRLTTIMPDGLDHVFFTNSGSEAVDTALKIALAYHHRRGEAQRRMFVGRARGFHGAGFGGTSVGGIANNRKAFGGNLLPAVDHLPDTHDPERNAFSRGQPQWGAERADALEEIVALHGAESIAAVIVEPMAGSTGVLVPPVGYLERLREICDRHGLLLIFDEVITAFGRIGAGSAAERFNVLPDMMTVAKGLTNGTVPMGGVLMSAEIHDTLMSAPGDGIELFHGYTYSGHPLACAAGLATLEVFEREGLFERAAELEPYWRDAVHSLDDSRHVIDVREVGIAAGIELEPREGRPGARAGEAFDHAYEAGAFIRVTGDVIALAPPLIIEKPDIDRLVGIVDDVLQAVD